MCGSWLYAESNTEPKLWRTLLLTYKNLPVLPCWIRKLDVPLSANRNIFPQVLTVIYLPLVSQVSVVGVRRSATRQMQLKRQVQVKSKIFSKFQVHSSKDLSQRCYSGSGRIGNYFQSWGYKAVFTVTVESTQRLPSGDKVTPRKKTVSISLLKDKEKQENLFNSKTAT